MLGKPKGDAAETEDSAAVGRAIFLSYRREDSQPTTIHIYQWLRNHGMPEGEIFLDDRAIPAGTPFPGATEEAVKGARCVLVVVGPKWAAHRRKGFFAHRSLWRDDDWVRREVELALQVEGRTLPVRVGGAPMPSSDNLPPSLRPFSKLQALELRATDTGFEQDMPALAQAMAERLVGMFDWTGERFVYLHGARRTYLAAVEATYRTFPLVVDTDHRSDLPDELDEPDGQSGKRTVYQKLKFRSFGTDPTHPWSPLNEPAMTRPAPWSPLNEAAMTHATAAGEPVDNLQEVLVRGFRRLVVLGRPGGGKTTLLRHTMRVLARQTKRSSDPLPVYIELPRLAPLLSGGERTALATYFTQPEELALHANEGFAPHLLEEVLDGRALVFLDGLDEVTPGLQDAARRWINERQRQLDPRGALVVGTRFSGYDRRDFPQFAELVAQEMDHDIRVSLAADLLPVLARQEEDTSGRSPNGRFSLDPGVFVKWIEERHEQWCGTPLLFSLAAYVYVQDGGELPESGIALYQRCITALLTKVVQRRQRADPQADRQVLMEQTNRILAEVALRLYETQDQTAAANPVSPELRDAQSFPVQLLLLVLEQIHEELRGLGVPDQPEIMAPWVKESGTLEVVVPEKIYRFVHHTYQEYLAAMGLAKRLVRAREPLAGKARHIMDRQRFAPHWAEPMRMLAGALVAEGDELRLPAGREFAKAWLANLLRQARDPQSLDRDAALALAVASLREIPNIESFGPQVDAAGMLDAWVEALLRTAAAGPAQTLGDLQRLAPDVAMLPSSLVRPPLDRLRSALEENGHPAPQIAAAQALAGMGDLADTEALERLLLAEDASQVARLEAARALCRVETRDLEHPGQAALERVLVSSNRDLARIVARALVEMGDVGYPLMLLATEDSRDAEVRQLGVLALGGVGPSARNTLQVLASDRDPEVAARAVEMLSRLGEDFETLLPVLTHMAEQGAKAATVASVLASLLPYTLRDLDFQGEVSEGVAAILPPLCLVPEGDFLMGSDRQKDRLAEDDELRQHTVTLGSYQIGAYPVTVAEYACFVRTGYKEPVDWQAQLERLDHPVVNVMWHDAMSYAVWLGRLTGQPWRLPTEAEWEKAARGSDGWIYPWGDAFDNARCNTIESSANGTTPVGSYRERGDSSPYNVHDMAGNVWEWTISLFRPYPYSQSDGSDISQDRGNRVLRGGSWSDQPGHARAAYRANFAPVSFNRSYGFRLVLPTAAGA